MILLKEVEGSHTDISKNIAATGYKDELMREPHSYVQFTVCHLLLLMSIQEEIRFTIQIIGL